MYTVIRTNKRDDGKTIKLWDMMANFDTLEAAQIAKKKRPTRKQKMIYNFEIVEAKTLNRVKQ